eukprot:Gregarina_sp_Poly_1__3568@NODE_2043_length_2783_cov_80_576951_g1318_i0_p3_GENE_NODE_2043_length_2783_cov_80_576951_g1318_i0NODE_2043_length_2783_cov_80_576951_g1318_i0_p3_ORF_typecomplete_len104_score10_02_NODE_2043_length_2783_cov_80_576951_g1318_i020772388
MLYTRVHKTTIRNVIQVGTFCRTMWVLFPIAAAYKMIRQRDNELKAIDKAARETGRAGDSTQYMAPPRYNLLGPKIFYGDWRLELDLAAIRRGARNASQTRSS